MSVQQTANINFDKNSIIGPLASLCSNSKGAANGSVNVPIAPTTATLGLTLTYSGVAYEIGIVPTANPMNYQVLLDNAMVASGQIAPSSPTLPPNTAAINQDITSGLTVVGTHKIQVICAVQCAIGFDPETSWSVDITNAQITYTCTSSNCITSPPPPGFDFSGLIPWVIGGGAIIVLYAYLRGRGGGVNVSLYDSRRKK